MEPSPFELDVLETLCLPLSESFQSPLSAEPIDNVETQSPAPLESTQSSLASLEAPLFSLMDVSNEENVEQHSDCTLENFFRMLSGLEFHILSVSDRIREKSGTRADMQLLQLPFVMSRENHFLGEGELSLVYEGALSSTEVNNVPVAVKLMPIRADWTVIGTELFKPKRSDLCSGVMESEAMHIKRIKREIRALMHQHSLEHPGVMKCYGVSSIVAYRDEGVMRAICPVDCRNAQQGTVVWKSSYNEKLQRENRVPQHQYSVLVSVFELGHDTLAAILRRREFLGERIAKRMLAQLADALMYIHSHNLVHGDIKPQNIIVQYDDPLSNRDAQLDALQFQCKITDFGLSWAADGSDHVASLVTTSSCSSSSSTRKCAKAALGGTAIYMSPQACKGEITTSSDIWSLGITSVQMLTGQLPWTPLEAQHPSLIINGMRRESHFCPQLDTFREMSFVKRLIGPSLAGLVIRCLSPNEKERPTAQQLLQILSVQDS